MKLKSLVNNKNHGAVAGFILALAFLLWEHFNGGVVTHHLLAREDLPGLSNWWGLLTIPLLMWIAIPLINKRQAKGGNSESNFKEFEAQVLKHFLFALAFGVLMSLLWEFNHANILQYLIYFPILVALFKPVHLPEYLMGFVLGMLFTFGGILPILFGLVLWTLCFLLNKFVRILKNLFSSKPN